MNVDVFTAFYEDAPDDYSPEQILERFSQHFDNANRPDVDESPELLFPMMVDVANELDVKVTQKGENTFIFYSKTLTDEELEEVLANGDF